jgi:hypothetical protein
LATLTAAWAARDHAAVKVLILAGQSNMAGYGGLRTLDDLGSRSGHASLLERTRNEDGSWVVHDDVCV